MNERNLYRGLNDFQGSITEDGRLYDERHRFLGRIEGNDVYDTAGIKQGTIDAFGKLWDSGHTFVGEERGTNFIGPSYNSTGLVRGDSIGEGRGREYGALMLLKKRNTLYSGGMPDNNYEFGNDLKRGLAADNAHEQDDYEHDDYDDARDDYDYEHDDYDYERDDYDGEHNDYDDGVGDDTGDVNAYHRDVNAYHRDVNTYHGGGSSEDWGCGCMSVLLLLITFLFWYVIASRL